MNIELLKKVREAILREPERFNMLDWFRNDGGCGTTACIAGWAHVISVGLDRPPLNVLTVVNTDALDLTPEAEDALFYFGCWPDPWKTQYETSLIRRNAQAGANVAADLIAQVIERGEIWWADKEDE